MNKEQTNFYVYIVECSDGSYYTGYTNDLDARIKKHNEGKASKYTRSHLPVKVVWWKGYESGTCARKMEYRLKTLTREEKEELVNGVRVDVIFDKSGK